MFGAAKSGEDGYLLLPNWAGCRTFFDKTYPRELRQSIYSSNDQWENNCNMAVWGITRAQGTLCAFVAQGDLDAELVSRVHWETSQLNASHASLKYRTEQHDERLPGDREIRYSFAPPQASTPHNFALNGFAQNASASNNFAPNDFVQNASAKTASPKTDFAQNGFAPNHFVSKNECGEGYVFCGRQYRDFLREERGVQTWDEKEQARPAATRDYLDRFFLKIFLAYKDPQPDGHGAYHATCTFDEARQILEKCLARGMTKLCVALVGWGRDGHDGMRPTQFPVDERLGGESGLRALASWCADNDIVLGVHDGYGASYSCSPDHNTDDLIRHRSGEYWESVIWSGGQVHLICPQVAWEKHIQRDMPAIREMGLLHHHIDAIGSFVPCFAPEHPLETRAKFIAQVKKMFELAAQTFGGVSTEYPFGPYFSVVDGFFHCYETAHPWQAASAAGRYFLDDMVPLIPIVLHGSHNCLTSLPQDDAKLAQAVDFGLHPQAEVCVRPSKAFGIPSYEEAAERLTQIYHQFYGDDGIANRLKRQSIEARFELAPAVHRTIYSDGTAVVVNRSANDFGDIAPNSFQVESEITVRSEKVAVETSV